MGALQNEVAPFRIKTTIVNPDFFYNDIIRAERNAELRSRWEGMNGNQSGDPKKLPIALNALTDQHHNSDGRL